MIKKNLAILFLCFFVHAQTTSTTLPPFNVDVAFTTTTVTQRILPSLEGTEWQPTTTYTTLPCGGSKTICHVEFDVQGDGEPECCTAENNRVCGDCLSFCMDVCGQRNLGVESCFSPQPNSTCLCSTHTPTCYEVGVPTSTSAPEAVSDSQGKPLYRFLFFLVLFLVIVALIYYVRRL